MKHLFIFTALSLLLTGCGGGGGGSSSSSVSGLNLPNSMSVVTADSSGSGKLTAGKFSSKLSGQSSPASKLLTDTDTQYMTDEANTYVYDASMESLDTVNMIMCLMEQTRATDMVNKGAYIALVNEDKCEQGQNQSSSGSTGQSSGGSATEFNSWTVLSTRASNTSDQIVQIWVPGETGGSDPMDGQTILVELTATEGVSASLPFGNFSMNFKGVIDAGAIGGTVGVEVETMKGHLQTVANSNNKPQFKFINVGGDTITGGSNMNFSFEEAANVILDDASGTGGKALTKRSESFGMQSTDSNYAIAFNSSYLLRGNDTNGDGNANSQVCKSRSQFNSQVWRYNLYHTDEVTFNGNAVTAGQRVELDSGFPFSYDSSGNGTDDGYGWVGYNGIWSEDNSLIDGATITQFDYQNDTTIIHTVNIADGKMIRRSAISEALTSFQGDDFQFWGMHPTSGVFDQYVVTVDSNNDFQITAVLSWGDNGPETSTTYDDDNDTNTAEVNVAVALTVSNNQNIWLWSDALGGNIVYVEDNTVIAANRTVTFYGEEFISPADSTLFPAGTSSVTLYCYDRCLIGGLDQAAVDAASSESDLYYTYSGTPLQYTLSVSNGKVSLADDSNSGAAVSAVGLNLTNLGNDWGINTGEMVTSQLADANSPWLIYDELVTYRFETGDNDWNRMVTVTNGSGVVSTFERPLQLNYTHTTANDANGDTTNNGSKFFLEYAGAGELWGFPWVEDSETNRWYSAVTLKDGALLSDGTNSFAVKAVESEQTMQTDNAGCSTLSVASLYSDTTLTLPTITNIGTVSITLSGKPDVTAAPAVVEGELQ